MAFPITTKWCFDQDVKVVPGVAVMLERPPHISKVGQSKEKGKTKQATHVSDFHAHGCKSSLWPNRLAR